MHLIDEITNELTKGAAPNLSGALFKAKVLAHQLGEQDFANWVNFEINGYPDVDSLPTYRKFDMTVVGTVISGRQIWQNVTLSAEDVPIEVRDQVLICPVVAGVAVIEGWISEGVHMAIPHDFYPFLRYGMAEHTRIESAEGRFGAQALRGCLNVISSRLLDFVLLVSAKLPASGGGNLKEFSKEAGVGSMFKDTVLNGATINVAYGSHSTAVQTGNSVQIKNDIDALIAAMKALHVADVDINELHSAISEVKADADAPSDSLGRRVQAWAANMLTKAGSAAWSTSFEVAAKTLIPPLLTYYGLGP